MGQSAMNRYDADAVFETVRRMIGARKPDDISLWIDIDSETRPDAVDDRVQLRRMHHQRHVEEPRCDVGIAAFGGIRVHDRSLIGH